MKKKKSNKPQIILLIIVLIFIGALEIFEYLGKEKTRDNLTGVKTDKITRIALSKTRDSQYVSLRKEKNGWFITADENKISIENMQLSRIMQLLTEMKPLKKVSSNKEDWEKFETNDALSLRITVYKEKDILSDIFVGRIELDEMTDEIITYVRVNGDQEVYSVKGDLHREFEQNFFQQIFSIE